MKFTIDQIRFMISLGLDFDFNNLSSDELSKIEDVISDKLSLEGFDEYYNPTKVGLLCESIFDLLD